MAEAPAAPLVTDDPTTNGAESSDQLTITVTTPQHASGLCLYFHTGDKRRLYRLAPIRDPRQPRLWGFAVFPCLQSGQADLAGAIWCGGWGASRPELETVLAGVRADADGWLAGDERAGLREALRIEPPLRSPALPLAHPRA